jgi:predicted DNA-binding transcriptional regulator AlpA
MPPIEEVPRKYLRLEEVVKDLYGSAAGVKVLERLQTLVTCLTEDRIVDWPEVLDRTSLSKRTVQRAMEDGSFPSRRQLSGCRSGWLNSDIVRWMRALPTAQPETDHET